MDPNGWVYPPIETSMSADIRWCLRGAGTRIIWQHASPARTCYTFFHRAAGHDSCQAAHLNTSDLQGELFFRFVSPCFSSGTSKSKHKHHVQRMIHDSEHVRNMQHAGCLSFGGWRRLSSIISGEVAVGHGTFSWQNAPWKARNWPILQVALMKVSQLKWTQTLCNDPCLKPEVLTCMHLCLDNLCQIKTLQLSTWLECLLCMPVIPSAKHGVTQNPMVNKLVPIKSAIWNSGSEFSDAFTKNTNPKKTINQQGRTKALLRLSKLHFRIVHEVNLLSLLKGDKLTWKKHLTSMTSIFFLGHWWNLPLQWRLCLASYAPCP